MIRAEESRHNYEARFTPREREIVNLISKGRTTKEIARHLKCSPRTIEGHRKSLLSKTGARNVAELARYAVVEELRSILGRNFLL